MSNDDLERVKASPLAIKSIKNQTKEMAYIAIRKSGILLRWINDELKTPGLVYEAVKQNGIAIRFAPEQTAKLCFVAVKSNRQAYKFIKPEFKKYVKDNIDKTEEELDIKPTKDNILENPWLVAGMDKHLYEEFLVKIVEEEPFVISVIENQTLKICELAVSINGLTLEHVKEEFRTDRVLNLAINNTGLAIKYIPVEKQTYIRCMNAIKQNPIAYGYVKPHDIRYTIEAIKGSDRIRVNPLDLTKDDIEKGIDYWPSFIRHCPQNLQNVKRAVRLDPTVLEFVNLTLVSYNGFCTSQENRESIYEMLLNAVRKNPNCLQYINKALYQNQELCLEAINIDPSAIKYSKYSFGELIEYMCRGDNRLEINEDMIINYLKNVDEVDHLPVLTPDIYDTLINMNYIGLMI